MLAPTHRALSLRNIHLSDACFKDLAAMKSLRALYVYMSHGYHYTINTLTRMMSGRGVKRVLELPRLETLYLEGATEFGQDCFGDLNDSFCKAAASKVPTLKFLKLQGCNGVTPKGLLHFESHKTLRSIVLRDCNQIGLLDAEAAQRKLPNLVLDWGPDPDQDYDADEPYEPTEDEDYSDGEFWDDYYPDDYSDYEGYEDYYSD